MHLQRPIATTAAHPSDTSTFNPFYADISWFFRLCRTALPGGWSSFIRLVWNFPVAEKLTTSGIGRSYCMSTKLLCTFWCPRRIIQWWGPWVHNWGVGHRFLSAYNPKSNGRAEVAVKSAKRLLSANTGPAGSLDTDHFLRENDAVTQHTRSWLSVITCRNCIWAAYSGRLCFYHKTQEV